VEQGLLSEDKFLISSGIKGQHKIVASSQQVFAE
jgi:hypothetical protein